MRDADLIEKARRGERITKAEGPSLFDAEQEVGPHTCHWRCIVCTSDDDVSECSKCGRQRVHACTFDDEYS